MNRPTNGERFVTGDTASKHRARALQNAIKEMRRRTADDETETRNPRPETRDP